MPRIGYRLLGGLLALTLLAASGEPPPVLKRGINITNWFRFPPSGDPAALRTYLDDAELQALRRAGFTFVRLPVQPGFLTSSALPDSLARIQRNGLAVVVALFADPADETALLTSWHVLAHVLRRSDPATMFPELLNEPVFADDAAGWARLQHSALAEVRAKLPQHTIILTGANWGGVHGLLALQPEADANVVYSFHLYEPAELTALGAYRKGLDMTSMARLPFPVSVEAACHAVAATSPDAQTAELMRFYCMLHWDADKVAARIAEAAAWGHRHRAAVLLGEFGASQRLNSTARLAWLAAVRQASEHEGIGWALWGYDDSMGFARHPPHDQGGLDPGVLQALGLPPRK